VDHLRPLPSEGHSNSVVAVCPSAAPSFDCKLARTTVETTICANAELGTSMPG
jgi:uncharacterized protein